MSVAEMKMEAITELVKLENESAVKEILQHLKKLNQENASKDMQSIFNKAVGQYGNTLKKLAE